MTTTKRTRAEVAAEAAAKRAAKATARLAVLKERAERAARQREAMATNILLRAREFGGDITEGQLRSMGRGYLAAATRLVEHGSMIRLNAQGDGARYGLTDEKALTA